MNININFVTPFKYNEYDSESKMNKNNASFKQGDVVTVNNSINDSIINTTIENLITDRNEHNTFKIDIFMEE